MALADIIKKIESDALVEAENILAHAQKEVDIIVSDSKKALKAFEETAHTDRDRRASKAGERIIAVARHEAKFKQQSFKNSMIESVFATVQKNLEGLSKEEYAALMERFVKRLPHLNGSFVLASERHDETKKILMAHGAQDAHITNAKAGALRGGFVMTTPDAEYDFSYKALVRNLRDEQQINVTQMLFA